MKYQHVSLGGTFDRLHLGHKYLLKSVFDESQFVTIGVTTEKFLKNKPQADTIESFDARKEELVEFLSKEGLNNRYEIIPLDDIYGNTLSTKNLDAIFVTEESITNAQIINKKRHEKRFPLLTIVKVNLIKGNDGEVVSSTRIRLGEVDREGKAYIKVFENVKELKLPENIREELQKPFGTLIKSTEALKFTDRDFVIAVGDITVVSFLDYGIQPNLSIFDYKTQRHDVDESVKKRLPQPTDTLHNNAGTIKSMTVEKIEEIMKNCIFKGQKSAVEIVGEEDLLSLPIIMLAPLGSRVYYGLRGEGMIEIKITEEVKKSIGKRYLEKFIR